MFFLLFLDCATLSRSCKRNNIFNILHVSYDCVFSVSSLVWVCAVRVHVIAILCSNLHLFFLFIRFVRTLRNKRFFLLNLNQ